MIPLLKSLIHYKTVEKLFLPKETLFDSHTYTLKNHNILLYKEKGNQHVSVEFNNKTLKDLKTLFSIEDKFF